MSDRCPQCAEMDCDEGYERSVICSCCDYEFEAAPIKVVFVVLISSKVLNGTPRVGPVYTTQADADAECARLIAANSYTNATWTSRQLG